MNALREVREITSDSVTISVPESLRHQKVEIIILPLDESAAPTVEQKDENGWPVGFFERFAGSLPDFPDVESEGDYEVRESVK